MPSPFPGMDPYWEGYLWPDVHHALTVKVRQYLTPRLKPRYVARLELSVEVDEAPEREIGIMYPDVEVVAVGTTLKEAVADYEVTSLESEAPESIPPAPLVVPIYGPVELHLATVEIRTVPENELVTCIELLSPVNKREPGLTKYRQKCRRLREAGVHLLELDLLRRGSRTLQHPRIPEVSYLISLSRAQTRQAEVWPLKLSDPLPVVPVPLRRPDPDVPLNLSAALTEIYDEAAYEISLDYTQPPPPPELSAEEMAWLRDLFKKD